MDSRNTPPEAQVGLSNRLAAPRLDNVRLEHAVPGPRGQLGFLLVAPPSGPLAVDLVADIPEGAQCWLEERQGWWIALSQVGALAVILDRHNLTSRLWLPPSAASPVEDPLPTSG
jgi:hypothetical protein